MSRKKKPSRTGTVWKQSAEEATLAKMPKYNGFAVGHGAHGDTKYNRCRAKRAWKQEVAKEARMRGPLDVLGGYCFIRS